MARNDSKDQGGGFAPGLTRIQQQLRRVREEGASLANRLRQEASCALADGQRAFGTLVDQVAHVGDDFQKRVQSTGREIEHSIENLFSTLESEVSRRTDGVLHRWSQTLRKEQDKLRERLRGMEARVGELTKQREPDTIREFQSGLTWARSALEQLMATVRQTNDTVEETQERIRHIERRVGEIVKENARDLIDADEFRHKLGRLEHWVSDVAREAGGKQGEQSALRERLSRLEMRFVSSTKEDATRTAAAATLKERLARIEARVGDLARELLAHSVVTDGDELRRKLAQLEHRAAEVSREASGTQGEQGALRERVARLETQLGGATVKERQARIEGRIGDINKELLARSIDLSTIRERLSNVEAQLAEIERKGELELSEEAVGNR